MKAFPGMICLVCVMMDTVAAQWQNEGISILSSSEHSLVIEFRPHFLPPQTIREGNAGMILQDFSGSRTAWTRENMGAPDLRFASVAVGFPSEEGNSVQVVAADYQDVTNVTLAPVPVLHFERMAERREYRINPAKYESGTFLPAAPAEISGPVRAQTMWVGSVRIYPVQFNPASRTARVYSRLVVEAVFGAPKGPVAHNTDNMVFRGVLLNYEVAKNWTTIAPAAPGRTSMLPSVLASGDWYRIPIAEEGAYVLTPAYLRSLGINTAALDPRTIRIFGNGGRELAEDILTARPRDLVENAILVEGEGDGRFDEGDYVLFFARSVRGLSYNTLSHTMSHYIHHYAEENIYWLTCNGAAGKRMLNEASSTENPVVTPAQFLDGAFAEEENVNIRHSGKEWFGRRYGAGDVHTYVISLPGLASGGLIHYAVRLLGLSPWNDVSPSFTISEGSVTLGEFGPPSWNEDTPTPFTVNVSGSSTLPSSTSRVTLAFQRMSTRATGWDDWVEVTYPRSFSAVGNYLRFRSPGDVTGVVEYDLGQFTAAPIILDVTHPEDVRRITGATGGSSFRAAETAGDVSEYCAVAAGGFKQPPAGVARVANQNLRGDSTDADFIILTSPEFRAAADRLQQRREQPEHGSLLTRVVDVNQVYNEFSGGLPDVTAIRDYLKYVYDIWLRRENRQSVFFVLFFGQGSYDYRGIEGARSSYVPTWQTTESLGEQPSYPTDDFYAVFGGNWAPSIVTGRVNARTSGEADEFVTKLGRYEDASARDAWKMRMIFVADDQYGEKPEDSVEVWHTQQAERLATVFTPAEFEKRKIYTAAYPTEASAQGRRKPGAYQAILDDMNEGALVTNYIGHGNQQVWAHEMVFNVETSIPRLVNSDKLSVLFAATCSFSRFDDPEYRTGSEVLLNKPDGGAIAVVGASRLVDSYSNARLHQGTFANMFRRDGFGRLIVERPATALYLYKLFSNDDNDQKFLFMGDPTMKLMYPSGYASIDSINHQPIVGVSRQLKALARVSLQGMVRDQVNRTDTTFQGRVVLTVDDVSRYDSLMHFAGHNFGYLVGGSAIFRGQCSVSGGRFSASFVVPRDISYGDSAGFGRIVVQSLDASQAGDGAGVRDSIRIGGTEVCAPDTMGPEMSLFVGSRSFRPGDLVDENPLLLVDLADSSGINTSVSGMGHRIEAWVNSGPQSKDLTEYYASELDDFQKGTVTYHLEKLQEGRNTVRVRAWDTHNNPAMRETFFEVASSDQLRISDVFNYPNPFSSGTTFTFRQNQLTSLNVKVKIYTVAGRLIQSLEVVSNGEPFIRVPWDGRDRDGAILANGVYLYKVIVTTADGRLGSESLGKMAVLK